MVRFIRQFDIFLRISHMEKMIPRELSSWMALLTQRFFLELSLRIPMTLSTGFSFVYLANNVRFEFFNLRALKFLQINKKLKIKEIPRSCWTFNIFMFVFEFYVFTDLNSWEVFQIYCTFLTQYFILIGNKIWVRMTVKLVL